MSQNLLEIRNVSKTFPGVKALDGVSLDLRPGEILGLCGENGAGKSTLMKILTGIYTADPGGEILLGGRPSTVSSPREAQLAGLAIIHQEFTLVPDLTVAQNVLMGQESTVGAGQFIRDSRQHDRASRLLTRLKIDIDTRAYVRDLSVAQQQMVEIAKAMSLDAQVLVMDEPTAALTESETATLFELIRDFVSPATGVIYISHRMPEIKELTDRVSVIRDGTFVGTVETAETSTAEIIAMMVGREVPTDVRPAARSIGEVTLQVRGLSTKALLRDVGFDVRRGEILGFAGLMGAGRTEVARAIVGADPIDSGTITIDGERAHIRNPADAVRLGIGYLSEDRKRYGLLLDHSIQANVSLSSLSQHRLGRFLVNDRRLRTLAQRHVTSLRVKTPSLRQRAQNLSGGNQQKVIIGKWLARDCDILIFDEPTRGIDVGAKEEIYELLEELAAAGKSIVMISSELPEILRLSDRVAVMCEGRLVGVVDNADATQEVIMNMATSFRDDAMGVAS